VYARSDAFNTVVDVNIENCAMWTRLTLPRVSVEILSGRTGYALPSTCEWLINRAYASC
jgi:hypothetical protein